MPIPPRVWGVAAVTGIGALLAMVDSTLVNLAVDTLQRDLGAPIATVQWVVTGYLVALAASLPSQAWLGRRVGHGRLWAASLASFVGASALCALAPGPGPLIVARVLQGAAAGLMVPAGQAVIGATARPDQLGRLMGALGLVIALGPAVGPALGGVVLESASWRWLFWANVPIGVAALVVARGLVPHGPAAPGARLDVRGLVTLAGGLPLVLVGATAMGSGGPTTWTVAAVGVGASLMVSFVRDAASRTDPLVDLRLLAGRTFGPAATVNVLTGANMYAGLLLIPLWLQEVRGAGPAETGLRLLVMGLGSAGALYLAGALTDRGGARPVVLGGGLVLVASSVPFLLHAPAGGWLTLLLASRGAGLALAQMPALTAAYAVTERAAIGDATTLVNIAQRLGGAAGAAGVAMLLSGRGQAAVTSGFGVVAVLAVLTVLAGAAMPRRDVGAFRRTAPRRGARPAGPRRTPR